METAITKIAKIAVITITAIIKSKLLLLLFSVFVAVSDAVVSFTLSAVTISL